jgi:hypothetical protein
MATGVDSRAKGQRAEYAVRDMLRDATKLEWDRVPGSGGFGASHGLKGDVYLPTPTGKIASFTIEVKHYKDDVLNSNLFNTTVSQLEKFWEQTVRESQQMNAMPMLVFKKDRGKWLVALNVEDLPIEYKLPEPNLIFNKGETQIVIFLFETLLATTTQEYFVK